MKTKGRTIWTIVWKLAVLLTSFWLLIGFCFGLFPFRLFDSEYSTWKQSRDWRREGDGCDVLIVGDSLGKNSWWPELLSDRTANCSLTNASPIECYFTLRDYLRYHEPPKALIYTITPYHFFSLDVFWHRMIYFHDLTREDIIEIYNTIPEFEDTTLFGGGQSAFLKQIFLYYSWSPTQYGLTFLNRLAVPQEEWSRRCYASLADTRGFFYYPDGEEENDVASWTFAYESFAPSEVADYYFRKTIELCRDNGIAFCYQHAPQNESTYRQIPSEFASEYTAYLDGIAAEYPEAHIDKTLFYYDNTCFKDSAHLNSKGATRFSLEMREKYRAYFSPNETGA